eukprot:m.179445 g.179445  ORF g.179445 m.179445 type:complete len:67 (-) comp15477_c0_seq3:117-317(-)
MKHSNRAGESVSSVISHREIVCCTVNELSYIRLKQWGEMWLRWIIESSTCVPDCKSFVVCLLLPRQ